MSIVLTFNTMLSHTMSGFNVRSQKNNLKKLAAFAGSVAGVALFRLSSDEFIRRDINPEDKQ